MNDSVPFRLRYDDRGKPEVEWVRTHGARFTEPSFEDTVARLAHEHASSRRAKRERTPLDALPTVPPGVPLSALVFHVSRCGSTLVSRMLAALPRNLVAAEPPIIDDLLRTSRLDPSVTDEQRIAWLRGAVWALGAARAGAERFFVKLDCWHLFSLRLLQRAFPGVPLVFVFRRPLPVVVSLLRVPSRLLVRDTLAAEELGMADAVRDGLSREEHVAAAIGALFRAATAHRRLLVPATYEWLPDFVWEAMPGGNFTAEERTLLREAARFDAKTPTRRFVADEAAKIAAASDAARAACARYAESAHAQWLAAIRSPGLSASQG